MTPIPQIQSAQSAKSAEALRKLSAAQRIVLARIAQGQMTKQIAAELGITEDGVNWHKRQIYLKLNVSSNVEAGLIAAQNGLV